MRRARNQMSISIGTSQVAESEQKFRYIPNNKARFSIMVISRVTYCLIKLFAYPIKNRWIQKPCHLALFLPNIEYLFNFANLYLLVLHSCKVVCDLSRWCCQKRFLFSSVTGIFQCLWNFYFRVSVQKIRNFIIYLKWPAPLIIFQPNKEIEVTEQKLKFIHPHPLPNYTFKTCFQGKIMISESYYELITIKLKLILL